MVAIPAASLSVQGMVTTSISDHACTPELVQRTGCNPGHVIVRPRDGDHQVRREIRAKKRAADEARRHRVVALGNGTSWPRVVEINFFGNDTTVVAAPSEIRIMRTGMYYLWFVICDKSMAGVWPRVVEINFFGNDTTVVAAPSEIRIKRTGMYYLWFVICDKSMAGVSPPPHHSPPSGRWPRVVEINFFGNDTTVVAAPSEIRIKMTGMYYLWFVICDKSMAGVSPPPHHSPPSGRWPRVVEINFFGNDTTVVAAPSEIRIKMTGMYYLWFVICDKSMAGVSVTGTTVWKNPDGYLPGMMAPYLLFYEIMAVVSAGCCSVLVLSMAEMAIWFFEFASSPLTITLPLDSPQRLPSSPNLPPPPSPSLPTTPTPPPSPLFPVNQVYTILGVVWFAQYFRFWQDGLQIHTCITAVYTILGIVWFAQYFRFWQDGLQIHTCITAVLVLSMAEMATWFFDFAHFNSSGFRPIGTTIWAATLGAIRKAVSRVLVLVVSMGFGVVRPTLGGLSGKVVALGVGYFAAVELLDVMQNVGAIDDLTSSERLFLVLPVAVLDAIFILWIFSALSKTLAQLQAKRTTHKLELYRKFTNGLAIAVLVSVAWIGFEAKRTTHKLELYRKFTNGLAIAVLVSVAWIGFEMYLRTSDPYNEQWEGDWITGCFWHVLTLMLLCLICVLWAPSRNATRNATRYAYSEDVPEELGEEEVALTAVYAYSEDVPEELGEEEVALTAVSVAGSSGVGGGAGGAEKKQAVSTDVFSLDDELEEGKKE
ncbi:unnamed protein product [Closterium sp. Naga37s-1]|nr:unnamed protein product [Closterium sp. Naga37s-1]